MKLSERINGYFHDRIDFIGFHFRLPQWLIKFIYIRCTNVFIFPSEIVNKYKDIDEIIEATERKFF